MEVRCYNSLESLPPSYENLFLDAAEANAWLSLSWFRTLAETTLGPGEGVRVYGLETKSEPHVPVAAIVMRSRHSVGKDAGDKELSALANFYSMEFLPVISVGYEKPLDALDQIFAYVKRERPRWRRVSFSAVPEEHASFRYLKEALKRNGYLTITRFGFGNYFEEIADLSYENFLKRLPSGIRRLRRKFEENDKLKYQIFTGGDDLELELALKYYEEVYNSSWKSDELYPRFMPKFIEMCYKEGRLRLGFIFVDDAPAATQLWVTKNGKSTIYKIAYKEAHKKLGLGSMLSLKMFQHAIETDTVSEIDYGSGDDKYKETWLKSRRERWTVVGYNPFTVGGAYDIAFNCGKSAVKAVLAFLRIRTIPGSLMRRVKPHLR